MTAPSEAEALVERAERIAQTLNEEVPWIAEVKVVLREAASLIERLNEPDGWEEAHRNKELALTLRAEVKRLQEQRDKYADDWLDEQKQHHATVIRLDLAMRIVEAAGGQRYHTADGESIQTPPHSVMGYTTSRCSLCTALANHAVQDGQAALDAGTTPE